MDIMGRARPVVKPARAAEAYWCGFEMGADGIPALPPAGYDAAERAAWRAGYSAAPAAVDPRRHTCTLDARRVTPHRGSEATMHIFRLPSGRYLNLDRIVDVEAPRGDQGGGVRVVMAAPEADGRGAHDWVTHHHAVELFSPDADALLSRLAILDEIETGYLEGMYRGGPAR